MACHFCTLPLVEQWYWAGVRVRLALFPDEPRAIAHYFQLGQKLALQGDEPWRLARRSLQLLLDSAADRSLPWHWRQWCLDCAQQPLRQLQQLACDEQERRQCRHMAARLAGLRLQPAAPQDEHD